MLLNVFQGFLPPRRICRKILYPCIPRQSMVDSCRRRSRRFELHAKSVIPSAPPTKAQQPRKAMRVQVGKCDTGEFRPGGTARHELKVVGQSSRRRAPRVEQPNGLRRANQPNLDLMSNSKTVLVKNGTSTSQPTATLHRPPAYPGPLLSATDSILVRETLLSSLLVTIAKFQPGVICEVYHQIAAGEQIRDPTAKPESKRTGG